MVPFGRLALLGLVVILVGAACGGDDASTGSTSTSAAGVTTTAADASTSTTKAPETETTVGAIGDHFDTAGGTATVTIGDETWEFTLPEGHPIATCDADFFGGFVAWLTTGGADIAEPTDWMSTTLPGGDFTDPPTFTVKLAVSGDAEWIADETIYEQYAGLPDGLGVTSFSIDGTTASGAATFLEQESVYQFNAGNGDLIVADGTFTVTCVAE